MWPDGMTGIANMTTAEIAEAVDASRYWRNSRIRILGVVRRNAFTWFAAQYLLVMGAEIFWVFATALCVLFVERRTNRFTMKTYSTYELVDRCRKVAKVEEVPYTVEASTFLLPFLSLLAVLIGPFLVPFYPYHVALFALMVSVLYWLKTRDQVECLKSADVSTRPDMDRRNDLDWFGFTVGMLILIVCLWTFALIMNAHCGIMTQEAGEQMLAGTTIVLSALGCGGHEQFRLLRVRKEIDRLEEKGRGKKPL